MFKQLSMLVWVTQLGFSVLFPLCGGLVLGAWLQQSFGLGMWVVAVLGVLGFLTSVSTAVSCVRSLLRQMNKGKDDKPRVPSFNQHK